MNKYKEKNCPSSWLLKKKNTNLLINSRFLSEELITPQLIEKYPEFCGIWSFITLFTNARHFFHYPDARKFSHCPLILFLEDKI